MIIRTVAMGCLLNCQLFRLTALSPLGCSLGLCSSCHGLHPSLLLWWTRYIGSFSPKQVACKVFTHIQMYLWWCSWLRVPVLCANCNDPDGRCQLQSSDNHHILVPPTCIITARTKHILHIWNVILEHPTSCT